MSGHIRRRGERSWQIKYEGPRDPVTGERKPIFRTVKGTKRDAQAALTAALSELQNGGWVEPSKLTVAEYIRDWLKTADVAPKTLERYRQLAEQQIIPHLGVTPLQKLRPAQVQSWHSILLTGGGKDGRPLSARTVGHAHRVLHRALARAATAEIVSRNVASAIRPPKVEAEEVAILSSGQMSSALAKLEGHQLFPIVALALGSGMRRGELLALRWADLALDRASVSVERSVEETKDGLRIKLPKTRHGRRTISLPPSAVEALREHRRQQLELRLALGLGREEADTLVFSTPEGTLLSPDNLSRDWRRAVRSLGLPEVMFHALRHSHASALIAAGLDVISISRRLGHGSPNVTLTVYGHLFKKADPAAASAIEAAMKRQSD